MAHLNPLTHLVGQLGGNAKSLRFAIDEKGNLKLGMQIPAVGTAAVGAATGALALDEGTWEHLTESTEAADEPATQFEVGVAGHFF
jgi:hypothetical protein